MINTKQEKITIVDNDYDYWCSICLIGTDEWLLTEINTDKFHKGIRFQTISRVCEDCINRIKDLKTY